MSLAQQRPVPGDGRAKDFALSRAQPCQVNRHLPAILFTSRARHVSQIPQAVYRFHRAVMLQLQPLGQLSNGSRDVRRQALNYN